MYVKFCAYPPCGWPFRATRTTARYCSAVCRVRDYRARLRRAGAAVSPDAEGEVITVRELAEALRESPDLPKAALLNRVKGLVKIATKPQTGPGV